jgi:hypothetical protein
MSASVGPHGSSIVRRRRLIAGLTATSATTPFEQDYTVALNIKDGETERLAGEVAALRHQPAHMSRDTDVDDSRCAPPAEPEPRKTPGRITPARLTAHTPYECYRVPPELSASTCPKPTMLTASTVF